MSGLDKGFCQKSDIKGCQSYKNEAVRNGDETCDYLDILSKRSLIQQRIFACQSKALVHLLQRELYTIGNSIYIRHEAKIISIFNLIWGISDVRKLGAPLFGPLLCSGLKWSKMEKGSSFKKTPLKKSGALDSIQYEKRLLQEAPLWVTANSKQ